MEIKYTISAILSFLFLNCSIGYASFVPKIEYKPVEDVFNVKIARQCERRLKKHEKIF